MRSLTPALLLLLTLTACSSGETGSAEPAPNEQSATSSPTPAVTPNASYGSVTDLRDAVVELGYPCPNWKQDNALTNASSSGTCSNRDVFSVYLDAADLKRQISTLRSVGAFDPKTFGAPMLAGPNWLLNIEDPEQYRDALGGTIIAN